MDEETIVDQSKVQSQTGNKEDKKNDKDALKSKRKITTATRITAAAFAGGMASRLFTPIKVFPNASVEGIFDSNAQTDESEPAPEASAHLVGHNMPVASEVNDSLGFNEAFAAARKETGPGGLFVWRGHTYGTYYKNEWDAMLQEEQDQYWADVQHTSQQIHYEESELESESIPELDVELDPDLENEPELDEEPVVESDDEEQELQEDDVVEFLENEEEDSNMYSFIKILDGVNKESKYSMYKENYNTYLFGQSTMDKSKIQRDNDFSIQNQKINTEFDKEIFIIDIFKDSRNQDLQITKLSNFDKEENVELLITYELS